MKKVRTFIERAYIMGQLPDNMSLRDFCEIGKCFNSLKEEACYKTISKDVAEFFRSNDFKINNYNVEYEIQL